MLEVCVAAIDESLGWARKKSTAVLTGVLLVLSTVPALSYSAAHLSFNGIPFLDIMDETVGTLGLYIAAVLLTISFTWFLPRDVFESQLGTVTFLNRFIFFLCKYVIPGALIITIVAHMISGIDLF